MQYTLVKWDAREKNRNT